MLNHKAPAWADLSTRLCLKGMFGIRQKSHHQNLTNSKEIVEIFYVQVNQHSILKHFWQWCFLCKLLLRQRNTFRNCARGMSILAWWKLLWIALLIINDIVLSSHNDIIYCLGKCCKKLSCFNGKPILLVLLCNA